MGLFGAFFHIARTRSLTVAVQLSFRVFFVNTSDLPAQQATGEIRLKIKDPSGATMQASGKLQNLGAGVNQGFQTDAQGSYTFAGLPYGRYRLEITRSGFATRSLLIDVQSESVSRAVTLALGSAAFSVDVIGTTPLPGVDLLPEQIPTPVQTANEADVRDSGALELSDFLNRRLNGVHLNEIQGNPYQPDLNYRGYTASPLLGTPQGLSVYMDGVRLNQPFGDVVSWDLIPRAAISEVSILPGSSPLFGLNTLGGALSIQTKDGRRDPGTSLELSGGSFGRKMAELEHGSSNSKGLSWFLASTLFFEDGWREHSPSNVRQFFGKLGWQRGNTTLGLTIGYANNSLIGNGLQEQRLLARDYASVYTIPDITANRAPYLILNGRHSFASKLSIAGNTYYRYIRTSTLNGDMNEDSLDQSLYQLSAADIRALNAAGYTGFPTTGANASNTPFPSWRCISQALERDEPGEKCNGMLNRTRSQQQNYGLSGQLTWLAAHNQFTVGAAYDGSISNFAQSSQLGYLNPDRSITGVNAYGDRPVDVHGMIDTGSIYATDTLTAGRWNFTVSGRYNRTTIDNHDRVQPVPGAGSLTATNAFGRFNPAAGVTYKLAGAMNAYFSYSEGSRAPTSIELGCADPNEPCKLPNALAGDPPLKQVVTRTLEAGLRGGSAESHFGWSAGWFRAANTNDILFVSSAQTAFGYFKNFGETLRQGAEVNLNGHIWRLTLGGGYTFVNATYQSTETLDGSSNSTSAIDGTIQIQPGDRIPLIPQHLLKAYAGFQATKKLVIDLDFVAVSRSYARGNENNLSQPDGKYYLGPGTSPGYGVVNLGTRYQVHRRVQLFVQINNLLDRRYYTGAQLGPTGFTPQVTFIARPFPPINGEYPLMHATFYAPGAPIGAWGGIRFQF